MDLNEVFLKNRAEELPDDLTGRYVLPLGYNEVNLKKMTKACIVIGGRGYGKTMFLKYHCHDTTLSPQNSKLDKNDLGTLGMYWRPDTSFSQLLTESWLGKYWSTAFKTYMCLCILLEFTKLIKNLCCNRIFDKDSLNALSAMIVPEGIKIELKLEKDVKIIEFSDTLQTKLFTLCNWINSPTSEHPPFSLDTKTALQIIISKLHEIIGDVIKPNIHVFVDEFENLTTQQQEVVNTLMKHATLPLLFSVAYKKNAKISHKTIGNESIVEQHDFRIIDLEELHIAHFDIFAGEILALRISDYLKKDYAKLISVFTTVSGIKERSTKSYQASVRDLASVFLPEKNTKIISSDILNDETLRRKLYAMIEFGLAKYKGKLQPNDFIDDDYAEASLINGALLNRKSSDPREIFTEFTNFRNGGQTKYKSWIPNNLVGVILYLYNKLPNRICPLYSGYKQFIYLSRGNIRHFLELCHQSAIKIQSKYNIETAEIPSSIIPSMDVDVQSYATLKTSELEIDKIGDFGAHGMHLKRVAKRLGTIYNYCQSRRSQSESEINHFTLDLTDINLLSHNVKEILNEALVWSVLIEQKGTKSKSTDNLEFNDYILHPVLAPYFGISHRKKRKIKFTKGEVETIFIGSDEDFSNLIKKYGDKWGLEDTVNEATHTTFQMGLL